ncbi:hypothetical protein [Cronobacter sakazakii]|uniref:hypothetical protein n=1 Tax=Cronobacter sakazakii TaxID=28141 RepID=UPI000CFCCE48|nr:hypothetical protein [Cronobacter sakazakii]
MAMNKKEKELYDDALRMQAINRALRWSDYDDDKDVNPPVDFGAYANGWSVNRGTMSVYKSWSSKVFHGDGWVNEGESHKHASQNPIKQYSTKEKALKALRVFMESKFASLLLDVDKQIKSLMAE